MPEKETMSLEDKINELNEYCKRSLSITYYAKHWEISSYRRDTLLNFRREYYQKFRHPMGETIEEVVNKAYNLMIEDMK